jgi:acetyl-CoA carboxylase biotin carboxyl carrier protein
MGSPVQVTAQMVASVAAVPVAVGADVAAGDALVLVESMKMEIPVPAPVAGTVTGVHVAPGDLVQEGDLLVTLDGRR